MSEQFQNGDEALKSFRDNKKNRLIISKGFNQWDLIFNNIDNEFVFDRYKGLSVLEIYWELTNKFPRSYTGYTTLLNDPFSKKVNNTVAHRLIRSDPMYCEKVHIKSIEDPDPSRPPFQWTIENKMGETPVRSFLLIKRRLPKYFTDWSFRTHYRNGATLAHVFARMTRDMLPVDFPWQMLDNNGVSVAHVAALRGVCPLEKLPMEILDLKTPNGFTVSMAHLFSLEMKLHRFQGVVF